MTESRYEYQGSRKHQNLVGRHENTPYERALTHRSAVMLMLPGGGDQGRRGMACVLGAGECHDLDLPELLNRHHEVHLVDLNCTPVRSGLEQQELSSRGRVFCHEEDVSGAVELLDEFSKSRDERLIDKLLSQEMPESISAIGQFEVLVSANMLPELMGRALVSLGIEHPRLAEVMAALRLAHIQTMLNMTRPGGQALLVTEVTTSQHIPELAAAPEDLNAILRAPESVRRMNPGCNPAFIDKVLRETPAITERLERYDMSIAWLRQESTFTSVYLAFRLMLKA